MSLVAKPLEQPTKSVWPDFRVVVEKLRNLLSHVTITGDNPVAHATAREALVSTEQEIAVQAVLYLHDHLTFHEQWLRAAQLLAFACPTLIELDPRIRQKVAETLELAEKMATPEMEQANFYLDNLQLTADEFIQRSSLQGRASYWIRATRLSGAKRALEYATGSGSNVMQAVLVDPHVDWRGMDISKRQIDVNNQQALRLNMMQVEDPMFQATHHEPWYGAFDTVAVLDVLEHTAFPHELLEQAERYCHENSVLVVSVPNGPWSLFTPNKDNVGVGQHIGTASVAHMQTFLGTRGRILDTAVVTAESFKHHGNSVAAVAYEPKSAKGRARKETL